MQKATRLATGPMLISGWLHAGFAIGIASLAGCASLPPPVHLEFLEHPPVSRDQTLAQLGPASSTFETDGVLTYRLGKNKADYYLVPKRQPGWEGVNYDLVLAFDETGILNQHRLVFIRGSDHAN